jgi:hypothetical protein
MSSLQDAEIRAGARRQIHGMDRVIAYGTLALSRLPQEQIARARAVRIALATILELNAG